jgi:hypothetical protein
MGLCCQTPTFLYSSNPRFILNSPYPPSNRNPRERPRTLLRRFHKSTYRIRYINIFSIEFGDNGGNRYPVTVLPHAIATPSCNPFLKTKPGFSSLGTTPRLKFRRITSAPHYFHLSAATPHLFWTRLSSMNGNPRPADVASTPPHAPNEYKTLLRPPPPRIPQQYE